MRCCNRRIIIIENEIFNHFIWGLWVLIFLFDFSDIWEPQQQQPSLIHPISPSCQSSGEHAHMLSLVVSFQGRVHAVVGIGMPLGIAARALMNWLWPFTPTFSSLTPPSLFCHLIFTHISLPIEVAEDNWQMPMKRRHNSCCLAAYANMFTYEGILSTENVPRGDASHVCCQARRLRPLSIRLCSHSFCQSRFMTQ